MEKEREIIERVLRGDRSAFVCLVKSYQALVAHVVFRMVKDRMDAEEICQDVFIKAHARLGQFRFQARFSTWLARIAYRTALNHLSKRRILLLDDLNPPGRQLRESLWSEPVTTDHVLVQDELRTILRKEIDRLPLAYKMALTLYHLHEMSTSEIGRVMDLPRGTVKSHLFRGRKILKERLLSEYQTERWTT